MRRREKKKATSQHQLERAIKGMTQLVDSTGSFHQSLSSNLPPAEGGMIALINPSPLDFRSLQEKRR